MAGFIPPPAPASARTATMPRRGLGACALGGAATGKRHAAAQNGVAMVLAGSSRFAGCWLLDWASDGDWFGGRLGVVVDGLGS
jgi:hypothetical protein